ncbi:MAG: hypothetical protein KDA58_07095 [Planctomycetaceae bacterium]|nr:hypothetical protein [Planctomycetaceae bacterium]
MSIEFYCKACDTLLRTPDRRAGQSVRCPACREPNWVPYESEGGLEDFGDENRESVTAPTAASTAARLRGELPSELHRSAVADHVTAEQSQPAASDDADWEFADDADLPDRCLQCGGPRGGDSRRCQFCGATLEPTEEPPLIPRNMRGIFECAGRTLSKNLGLCVYASLVDLLVMLMGCVVVFTPPLLMLWIVHDFPVLAFLGFMSTLFLGVVILYSAVMLGHAQFYFHLVSGERPDVLSILHIAPRLRSMLWATLLYLTAVMTGLMFFIVPGVFVWAMLGMYPFVLVDRNLGAIDSLAEAWKLSSNNLGTVLAVGLLVFLIVQIGNTVPGGFLLAVPFGALCHAYMYVYCRHRA